MKAESWKELIEEALVAEADATPAPDGSTPLTNIAERIRRLDPTDPERAAVIRALSALARDAPARRLPWVHYCDLVQLTEVSSEDLRAELGRSLSRGVPSTPRERIHLMLTLTDLGRHFYPAELEQAKRERTSCPEQWIDVAVRSGCWELANTYLTRMLGEGLYKPSHLLLRFSAWYQWNKDWVLENIHSWVRSISSTSDKARLLEWFTRRGIPIPDRPVAPTHQETEPIVPKPDLRYLQQAAQSTAAPVLH